MEKKVALNSVMVSHLSEVVGISMRELSSRMGMPNNTLTHWTEQGTIRVRDLVKLCNLFHIPFRAFLTFGDGQHQFRTATTIALPRSEFRQVVFHYDRIRTCGKFCQPTMALTSVASGMHISFNKFKKFYSEQEANNFTVDDFLRLCEVTGLPMEHFLDDPSWDSQGLNSEKVSESLEKSKELQKSPKKSGKIQENLRSSEQEDVLIEENRKLREQVERLLGRVEQLEKKLDRVVTKEDLIRTTKRYSDTPLDLLQTGDSGSCQ